MYMQTYRYVDIQQASQKAAILIRKDVADVLAVLEDMQQVQQAQEMQQLKHILRMHEVQQLQQIQHLQQAQQSQMQHTFGMQQIQKLHAQTFQQANAAPTQAPHVPERPSTDPSASHRTSASELIPGPSVLRTSSSLLRSPIHANHSMLYTHNGPEHGDSCSTMPVNTSWPDAHKSNHKDFPAQRTVSDGVGVHHHHPCDFDVSRGSTPTTVAVASAATSRASSHGSNASSHSSQPFSIVSQYSCSSFGSVSESSQPLSLSSSTGAGALPSTSAGATAQIPKLLQVGYSTFVWYILCKECIHVCMCMYACMYVRVCTFVCMHVYTYACVYWCMYVTISKRFSVRVKSALCCSVHK